MSKPKTKSDVAQAVPKPGKDTVKDRIKDARDQLNAFKTSPGAAAAPLDVHDTADAWGKSIDDLEANDQKIAPAETALQTLRNNEPVLVRRSDTKKRAFFSAVNVYCDGSADKITGLSCQVMSRASLPPSGVPEGLHDARPTTRGVAEAAWKRNKRSFLVQTCTNPADAATFAEPVYVSKTKYRLTGQTPGVVLHIRVLTLDAKLANGKSDWTPWVPINVAV